MTKRHSLSQLTEQTKDNHRKQPGLIVQSMEIPEWLGTIEKGLDSPYCHSLCIWQTAVSEKQCVDSGVLLESQ